jgi:site-specific DNA-methyltransferase (adenine-specific)
MTAERLSPSVELHCGDCLAVLPTLAEGWIDSCVTDPPYHLTSIVKRFGSEDAAPAKSNGTGVYSRSSRGFMGKQWDGGEVAFEPETWAAVLRVLKPGGHLLAFGAPKNFGFMQYAIAQAGFEVRDVVAWLFGSGFPKSHNVGNGWGTALKPAYEPIILARKPLIGTVAENVLKHGTGALNIDGCRIATDENLNGGAYSPDRKPSDSDWVKQGGTIHSYAGKDYQQPPGRFPANVIHDGSDDVVGAFPFSASGTGAVKRATGADAGGNGGAAYGKESRPAGTPMICHGDEGSAARFFYTAKADADDRLGSKHPTVKPLDLMQYLVRLVTPPGGFVLDPFAGTGTTGEAAFREGMKALLIEREEEYQADIRRRMQYALAGPEERQRVITKTKGKTADPGPLFA